MALPQQAPGFSAPAMSSAMLPSADSAHSVPDRCRTGLAGQYGLAAQAAARPRSRGHCDLRPWPGTPAAGARLGKLVTGGALADASRAASQQGLGILIRVGPLGDLPGAAELVRISFLDPPTREDGVRVTRWEATGPPAACSRSCTVTSRSPRPASSQHGWHSRASTAAAGPAGSQPGPRGLAPGRRRDDPSPAAHRRRRCHQPRSGPGRQEADPRRPAGTAGNRAGLVIRALRRLAVVTRPELLA